MKQLLSEIKAYYANEMSQGNWKKALALYQRLPGKFQDKKLLENFIRGTSTYKLIDNTFNIWKGIIERLEYAVNGELSQTPINILVATESSLEPDKETPNLETPKEQPTEPSLEAQKAKLSNELGQIPEGEENDSKREAIALKIVALEQEITKGKKSENMSDEEKALEAKLDELVKDRRNAAGNRKKWQDKLKQKEADENSVKNSLASIKSKILYYDNLHAKYDKAVEETRQRIEA